MNANITSFDSQDDDEDLTHYHDVVMNDGTSFDLVTLDNTTGFCQYYNVVDDELMEVAEGDGE